VLADNQTTGNGDAGLYVGGNQEVDATVVGNTIWDNAMGIFLRDVSHGTATGNDRFGNCTGILMLANAPGPVTNWKIRHNLVRRNNKTDCGEGATSGTVGQRHPQEPRPAQPAVRHLLGRHRRRQPVRGEPVQDLPTRRAVRLT
jgi:hypothetical protein